MSKIAVPSGGPLRNAPDEEERVMVATASPLVGPRQLAGLSAVARHLRLPAGTDRRQLRRWIKREGMPVRLVLGRYYADPGELDAWWTARPRVHNGP